MTKNKILAIILAILIIITVIVLVIYFYPRYKFSYENVKEMLLSAETTFSNLHNKVEMYDGEDELIGYYDIYTKDHLTYTYQLDKSTNESSEIFEDRNENKHITVINPRKRIIATTIPIYQSKNSDAFFEKANQNATNEQLGVFEYLGIETYNNLDCLKVSLTDNYSNYQDVDIYYIDLATNLIVKNEYYTSKDSDTLTKMHTEVNIFEFNTVKDEDIKLFNLDNYPEYSYRD